MPDKVNAVLTCFFSSVTNTFSVFVTTLPQTACIVFRILCHSLNTQRIASRTKTNQNYITIHFTLNTPGSTLHFMSKPHMKCKVRPAFHSPPHLSTLRSPQGESHSMSSPHSQDSMLGLLSVTCVKRQN